MTTPTSNLQILAPSSPEGSRFSTSATWGLPLIALVLSIAAIAVVWLAGDIMGLPSESQRITAAVWIAIALAVVLVLHFLVWMLGGYAMAEWLFQNKAGTQRMKPLKRDARLQNLCDELRVLLGWRWRYRTPWLLVCGEEEQVNAVAPGLKQAGALQVADTILVHPSPDGVDTTVWRKQLRRLRRRRPVDAVVQIVGENQSPTAATKRLRTLSGIEADLGWAAPVTLLHAVEVQGKRPEQFEAVGAFAPASPRPSTNVALDAFGRALRTLENRLANAGIQRCVEPLRMPYLARVSCYVSGQRARILESWAALHTSKWRRATLTGVLFAPLYPAPVTPMPVPVAPEALDGASALPAQLDSASSLPVSSIVQAQPLTLTATWQAIGANTSQYRGRRVGIHARTVITALALSAIGLWIVGMLISGLQNERDLQAAQQAAHDIQSAPNAAARLKALDTLQQQIQRYEYRVQHHAPLFTRFGLNRDADVLAALWKPYAKASRDILVSPAAQDLEATLVDLSQLQTSGLNEEASKWALQGHDTLKAYLMLAHPERVDAAFLAQQLAQHWTTDARIPPGQKQDLAERFARFYAEHLKANPDWRIEPRPELVTGVRQTLLAVIGERNAQDTIYQGIINGAGNKYPDQTLASLTAGTDPRGLLRAVALVPGVFTRQAYEGYVAAAIEEAAKRKQVASDWVLTGGKPPQPDAEAGSGKDLQGALTEQYFDEYADHWQQFMNSAQWEPAATLPAVIDQLKLLADARQSPVIALMRSLEYQGGAGARKDSLSDTLVNKARDLIGKTTEVPEVAKADPAGPLGIAFGPVLRLVGQGGQGLQGNQGDLSLQRYLDRATALRLRLQQISTSSDGDAQARQMAQALFQGKGSELADTQAYAQLVAASLGNQWAGMGDALFVRPIAQATQAVLLPAQASLDDAWRQNIAMAWGRSFAGRYPFADTANDASLPELARFLRPQSGLIHAFLATNLAGVLELQGDQWLPTATAGQAMAFDPAFLKGINTLQHIAAHLLAQGEPSYRFQLKPIPTPGLTDTLLSVDNQKVHYYNQREAWQSMTWPASNLQEPGTRLQWQTEKAGTNKNYEFSGPWGWVRMLERARVVPIDSATFQLTWQASADTGDQRAGAGTGEPGASGDAVQPDAAALIARDAKRPASADLAYPISYQLRTDVSQGPLEMLWLRGFVLPSRIFAGKEPAGRMTSTTRK
ncbi:ImcF-related family protein [Cupriavidus pinatubonensis]|uniref:Type VI secretion protein VasK n=1 Tax=Cupriavidus pinatubonensis TaxID=248026 RepID=A0ABM8Y039_9BURK|nr:ImcF-related family protein [Cupriavidus pinatubonensis]CAG9186068.1 hypothetical protein LMG23994_06036 [Cupriavidus pinatubonensis]